MNGMTSWLPSAGHSTVPTEQSPALWRSSGKGSYLDSAGSSRQIWSMGSRIIGRPALG